jgi:competence protein ComGC|tara:strand:+ start:250 stop:459 length:210 start_codon:yes stop_codon:yes gene_type:complete
MVLFANGFPVLELLMVFSIIVVIYLVFLEVELKQLRKVSKKFQEDEHDLVKELRLLREEISELKEIIKK